MEFSVVVAEDESLLLHVHDEIKKIEQLGLGFSVKGSAQTGIQALELVRDLAPDVLVTDIRMPVMDGLELVEKAKELFPELLEQLTAHLTYNATLGDEFSLIFG